VTFVLCCSHGSSRTGFSVVWRGVERMRSGSSMNSLRSTSMIEPDVGSWMVYTSEEGDGMVRMVADWEG